MLKTLTTLAATVAVLAGMLAVATDADAFSAQKGRMNAGAEKSASGCTIVDDRGQRHRMTNGQTVPAVDQAPMLKKYNQCSCPSATHTPVVKRKAELACLSNTLVVKRPAVCDCAPKRVEPVVVDARVVQACVPSYRANARGARCPDGYKRRSGGTMGSCQNGPYSHDSRQDMKIWALCVKYR